MPKLERLYKAGLSDSEKIIEWDISVTKNSDGTGTIETVFGLQDGKKQTIREVILAGKNIGRSNETTPYWQAVKEAEARWAAKRKRHKYGVTVAESLQARLRAPMLALVYQDYADEVDWENAYAQPKLDGFRCIAECLEDNSVKLWSREGQPITTLDHVTTVLSKILRPGDRLDGELFSKKDTFQRIASLIRKKQKGTETIQYHVYDMPQINKATDFYSRYRQLKALFAKNKGKIKALKLVETVKVTSASALALYQAKCLSRGYEGAMLRHGKSGYSPDHRDKQLLKVKTFKDAEFKITAVREGRGKCKGMCVFICETAAGAPFEVFAHGTQKNKRKLWEDRAKHIGRKLTVKYQEMTTSENPVPRFPVALRFYETL
jgi:DNA ligase-1